MDKKNIEDIFRLTDLQEALLLHRLQDGEDESGFLLLQGCIRGDLNLDRFRAAWQEAVDRHRALRTSIHWEGLAHPVQVVARKANVQMEILDWRSYEESDRTARFHKRIEEEKQRNVDLARAPVDRLILMRTEDQCHQFIWTCHHILLDGWSSAIVLNEVFAAYHHGADDSTDTASAEIPFKDYVSWLNLQDKNTPERFWRDYLATESSVLASKTPVPGSSRQLASRVVRAESVSSQAIGQWARKRRVTANCLFQGAWALLLAERTGCQRPVFGITVSGRGAPMKGIESMVGMFANTLPVALEVDPRSEPDPWFKEVFKRQMEVQRYEHCPLGRILDWGGVSLRKPLFDSLIVFANFPFGGNAQGDRSDAIELVDFQGDVTSSFPLTIIIRPGDVLELEARYDARCFEPEDASAILDRFQALIEGFVSRDLQTLGNSLTNPDKKPGRSPKPLRQTETSIPFTYASDSEKHLAQIWDDLVGVPAVNPEADLFSVGGHSLAIPRLLTRVHHDFGMEIDIGKMLKEPTLRYLDGLLSSELDQPTWKTLVPLRPTGSKPPLIILHHLGPGIGHVYDLAGMLSADQPVYAIQAGYRAVDSLEAMAGKYLEEVVSRFPSGPVQLVGAGFGGCLAYEIACQLAESGRIADRLILIDTLTPKLTDDGSPRPLARMLRSLRRGSQSDSNGAKTPDPRQVESLAMAYQEVGAHHLELWRQFTPEPYRGAIRVIQSASLPYPRGLGWKEYARGTLEIKKIPGSNLLNPDDKQLRDLAREISS